MEELKSCDCGLKVCPPWHTDENYKGCTFPDCGCAGARNCMVRDPNEAALSLNREQRSKHGRT